MLYIYLLHVLDNLSITLTHYVLNIINCIYVIIIFYYLNHFYIFFVKISV